MLVPQLTVQPSSTIPTADPRPLMYVAAMVIGALVLWVIYTLLTAETRKPSASTPAKAGDDAAK